MSQVRRQPALEEKTLERIAVRRKASRPWSCDDTVDSRREAVRPWPWDETSNPRESRLVRRARLARQVERALLESRASVKRAIEGLLRIRDFMGLQLNHAWGNMTDEEFNEASEEYLSRQETANKESVERDVRRLLAIVDLKLDSETISDIFDCTLDDADDIVKRLQS